MCKTLGNKITVRMFVLGMDKKELCEKSGIGMSAIYKIIADKQDPRFSTICKIAKALGVPVSYFNEDD
jgi:transcriptional regulator with XRE-family HTH domain